MSKVRYFDASGSRHTQVPMLETFHSDFLRTGRFNRDKGRRGKEERRYLSHDQVAEITGRKLLAVGEHAAAGGHSLKSGIAPKQNPAV